MIGQGPAVKPLIQMATTARIPREGTGCESRSVHQTLSFCQGWMLSVDQNLGK